MSRILVVGERFSSLTGYLEQHGHDYILLKDVRRTKYPEKRLKRRVVCDFSSKQSILATVDKIKKPIDGLIVTYENYILPSAWIAEHLGLPGIPVDSAVACTDKSIMRAMFAKSPEQISPDYAVVTDESVIRDFAAKHKFPLILKPANLAKSLLVTKNHNPEELLSNYQRTTNQIDAVYRKYAPNRQPLILVEEFLEGSIHSVDAFVDKNGKPHVLENIVDYLTGYDIGYADNFHYARLLPSKLSSKDQKALRHTAELGCYALGMKNIPAHIEIIMTMNGPRIVEIGARNGGYRERMHKYSNGIDINGAALDLVFGRQPVITASKNNPSAVLELFPKEPGIFKGIKNEKRLRNLPSFNYASIKAKVGEFAGKSADGYKMCAVVILTNDNQNQFDKDLRFVNESVYVTTKQP